eukprot:CAMPEP_0174380656 /NCGR_PEP_ID=MMETSP0811_2-20130205/123512_1 /TAXON_ID=73025 ORGANISM="Eutreptiella gymnastica-like, Strain CCMP1594" /NCGR_SAMPLE_ID=MMETSP0811_2 /ASSEMBLY_ACC=CAM_ASM_000667 /LENGTH=80 /DNA_ID=CAMNT_0015533581 /DNA_START=885 /DNA_END=1128 /DNA_ORIENTATION=-
MTQQVQCQWAPESTSHATGSRLWGIQITTPGGCPNCNTEITAAAACAQCRHAPSAVDTEGPPSVALGGVLEASPSPCIKM